MIVIHLLHTHTHTLTIAWLCCHVFVWFVRTNPVSQRSLYRLSSFLQEMKAIKEKEDEDVVIVCDPDLSTSHEAFLRKLKQQTGGATIPGRTLERAMSSPLVTSGHHMPSLIAEETPSDRTFLTGRWDGRG